MGCGPRQGGVGADQGNAQEEGLSVEQDRHSAVEMIFVFRTSEALHLGVRLKEEGCFFIRQRAEVGQAADAQAGAGLDRRLCGADDGDGVAVAGQDDFLALFGLGGEFGQGGLRPGDVDVDRHGPRLARAGRRRNGGAERRSPPASPQEIFRRVRWVGCGGRSAGAGVRPVRARRRRRPVGRRCCCRASGGRGGRGNDYAGLAREGYQKNAVAYRCIRMIAEAAASAPFAVFVDGVRDETHPLARLIRRPNPEQSGAELMEAVYGSLQVSGNAWVEAVGDAVPEELWALRSDRVKVVPGRSGWPEAWDYSVDGRSIRIGRAADGWAPVMQLKLWHPLDDWYGLSPLEAAAQGVDAHNAAGAWNKALLDNGARPSGALIYGAKGGERLTDGQFEALKAQLSSAYAGVENAGRPILLEGGMDWKPLSLTPAEMDFTAGRHAAAREIALAFGVPPQLLGIPGDATYSNYREANTAFWRQTVIPLARKAAGAMTGWLGGRFPGCEVRADLEAVPALQPERDALWARLEAASFLTDAERRRMAGVEG